MAFQGKDKKRKALSASTFIPFDPPNKKVKPTAIVEKADNLKKTIDISKKDNKTQSNVVKDAKAVLTNEAVVKSKKSQKHAADFLENEKDSVKKSKAADAEGSKLGAAQVLEKIKTSKKSKHVGEINGTHDTGGGAVLVKEKPKKVKNIQKDSTVNKQETNGVAEAAEAVLSTANTAKLTEKQKKGALSVGQNEKEPVPKPKKSISDFHTNRLEQLLGAGTPQSWQRKGKWAHAKAAETRDTSISSDDDSDEKSDSEVETTDAKRKIPLSMKAEAQNTVDAEMEDEYGSGDGESDEEDGSGDDLKSDTDGESDGGADLNSNDEAEAIDHAPALLAGFDSDSEDLAQDEEFDPNEIQPLPDNKMTKKKISKALRKNGNTSGPGTIYVGRIPHGFYEQGMRGYFSQFGTITNLRLSRNRRTGASKHFAFIEFESNDVAKIAAETMDNYLMFGHILKCKYVPQENLHPDVWKGANKRYKPVPYVKLEKKQLEAPKTVQQWELKIQKEQKKREAKVDKLKQMGYEMPLPKMKSPDEALTERMLQETEKARLLALSPPVGASPTPILEAGKVSSKVEVVTDVAKKSKKSKNERPQSAVAAVKGVEELSKPKHEKIEAVISTKGAVDTMARIRTKTDKQLEKERRETEEAVNKQLQTELNQSVELLTSDTILAPSSKSTLIAQSVAEDSALADEEVKKKKRKSKRKSSIEEGGVVLAAAEPLSTAPVITVPAETNFSKKEKSKSKKPKGLVEDEKSTPVIETEAPAETKEIEKKKLKLKKSETVKDDGAILSATVEAPAEVKPGKLGKVKSKKSKAVSEDAGPALAAIDLANVDKKSKKKKPDNLAEATVSVPKPKSEKKAKKSMTKDASLDTVANTTTTIRPVAPETENPSKKEKSKKRSSEGEGEAKKLSKKAKKA